MSQFKSNHQKLWVVRRRINAKALDITWVGNKLLGYPTCQPGSSVICRTTECSTRFRWGSGRRKKGGALKKFDSCTEGELCLYALFIVLILRYRLGR